MKHLRYALIALGLFCASHAEAATCFWVGGTGTYSTTNGVSWASTTGGTASTCAATGGIPKNAGDIATFDANSGAGTVTFDSTLNGMSIASIVSGNSSVTLTLPNTGNFGFTLTSQWSPGASGTTGVYTLNLGVAAITLSGNNINVWDCTACSGHLTLNPQTSVITVQPASNGGNATFIGGGLATYGSVTFAGRTVDTWNSINGSNTFATLTITGTSNITLAPSSTTTVTNQFSWGSSSSTPIYVSSGGSNSSATITAPANSTMTWAALYGLHFTNATTATNSFDLKNNTNVTITPPTSGGNYIIGGN